MTVSLRRVFSVDTAGALGQGMQGAHAPPLPAAATHKTVTHQQCTTRIQFNINRCFCITQQVPDQQLESQCSILTGASALGNPATCP